MANSATSSLVSPIVLPKCGDLKIYQKIIVLDTISNDLIIHSPAADRYAALVGLTYREADAHNLTIKSGSVSLVTLQQAANGGMELPISEYPLVVCAKGEDLIFNTSAAIATMLAYVAELEYLTI